MIKNFISNLFCNPKGNGIVRQVRRAEHKVAVAQAKKQLRWQQAQASQLEAQ